MEQIEKVIPAKYLPWLAIAAWLVPYLGRAYTALKNGGGIYGVYRAIVFGSTTVHNDDAGGQPASAPAPQPRPSNIVSYPK
jgi:hypothetical protein